MNDEHLDIDFYVAGVKYHKLYDIIDKLKEGNDVQLIPEPDNKYDKYAIRIEALDTMLGYIPRILAVFVAAKIKSEIVLSAKILEIKPESDSWTALKVRVKEESKDV